MKIFYKFSDVGLKKNNSYIFKRIYDWIGMNRDINKIIPTENLKNMSLYIYIAKNYLEFLLKIPFKCNICGCDSLVFFPYMSIKIISSFE